MIEAVASGTDSGGRGGVVVPAAVHRDVPPRRQLLAQPGARPPRLAPRHWTTTRRPRPGSGPTRARATPRSSTPTTRRCGRRGDDPGRGRRGWTSRRARPPPTPRRTVTVWSGPDGAGGARGRRPAPGPAPRRGQRPGRVGGGAGGGRDARRLPAGADAHSARCPTGSASSGPATGCAGTTTPRRRPRRRCWPRWPGSPRSCSSPAGATRASTWVPWPPTAPPVRAVVAIGEAAGRGRGRLRGGRCRSAAAVHGAAPWRRPPALARAGRRRAALTRAAPASTGTASYAARGDDFAAHRQPQRLEEGEGPC